MTSTRWWFRTDPDDATSRRVATQDAAIVQLARSAAVSGGDLEDAFRETARVAATLLDVSRVSVWLFDEGRKRLCCWCLHAPDDAPSGPLVHTAEDFPRYFASLDEQRVLDADCASTDPRTAEFAEVYLSPLGITSMLDAPIRAEGTMLGVVCHEHVGPPRTWREDEKRFASAIGDLLAVAIQSAERRRAEIEREGEARLSTALAHLGEELISGFIDPSTGLTCRLCDAAAAAVECSAVHVLRRDGERRGYVWVASAGVTADERAVSEALFVPDALVDTAELDEHGVSLRLFDRSEKGPLDALSARFAERILVVTAAIRRGTEVAGLLCVQRRGDLAGQPFSETDQRIVKEIGRVASMALETERLIDELKSARRVKSDFLSMMSHELRTPLNAISGYAELLLDGALGALNEEQRAALETIRAGAMQQCRMVENVLSVEKFERGEVRLRLATCGARALLGDVLDEIPAKPGVDLRVDVPDDVRPIRTDAPKLRAALREIVDNAVKFTPQGTVRVAAFATNTGVAFSILDTGVGMPDEVKVRMFSPFYQADSSSTRRFGGIGIGLYLARELVAQLDGTIEVDSEPGGGTLFVVRIPSLAGSDAYDEPDETPAASPIAPWMRAEG